MTIIIFLVRLVFVLVALAFGQTGVLHLIRLYENAAADGARGEVRKVTLERVAKGLGAWARDSGCLMILLATWPLGILPRGRLRAGSWIQAPDETRHGLPVLLVPGYGLNRASLELLRRRLEASHRPALAIDFPRWGDFETRAALLESAVIELKRATQSEKIDLVCHSQGGLLARWWILTKGGAPHVERCITLGTPHHGTKLASFGVGRAIPDVFPGSRLQRELLAAKDVPDVRFITLNAEYEVFVQPPRHDELPAPAVNVRVPGATHLGLTLSATIWRGIHAALRRHAAEELEADHSPGFEDESTEEAALRALARFSR